MTTKDPVPPIPSHPDHHAMTWTDLEFRTISDYGDARAAHARRVALEEAARMYIAQWLNVNAPSEMANKIIGLI